MQVSIVWLLFRITTAAYKLSNFVCMIGATSVSQFSNIDWAIQSAKESLWNLLVYSFWYLVPWLIILLSWHLALPWANQKNSKINTYLIIYKRKVFQINIKLIWNKNYWWILLCRVTFIFSLPWRMAIALTMALESNSYDIRVYCYI